MAALPPLQSCQAVPTSGSVSLNCPFFFKLTSLLVLTMTGDSHCILDLFGVMLGNFILLVSGLQASSDKAPSGGQRGYRAVVAEAAQPGGAS